jgi:hypothetical protein
VHDFTNPEAYFSIETTNTPYRRFGAVAAGGRLYLQYTDGGTYTYPGNILSTTLETGQWYTLQLVLDNAGGFVAQAFQENKPEVRR